MLETTTTLDEEVLSHLQDLIELNIDSSKGFREAAEQVDHHGIAELFRRLSNERSDQAQKLQSIVAANGKEPESSGSMAGAAHRKWLDLRAKISEGPHAVLAEAERGEDVIKGRYEKVLEATAGSAVTDLLNQQYAQIKRQHDLVRDLRDSTDD